MTTLCTKAALAMLAGGHSLHHQDEKVVSVPAVLHEVHRVDQADLGAGGNFSSPVAISGQWALMGSWIEGGNAKGLSVVFPARLDGGQVAVQPPIVPTDARDGDQFGRSLGIHDGTAIIGAPGLPPGAAYVLRLDDRMIRVDGLKRSGSNRTRIVPPASEVLWQSPVTWPWSALRGRGSAASCTATAARSTVGRRSRS